MRGRLGFAQIPADVRRDRPGGLTRSFGWGGQRPLGYRAPAFSITRDTPWAYEALSEIRLVDVEAVCALAGQGRPALGALLADLVRKLQSLSDALFAAYLTPATISRALASPEIVS